MRKESYTQSYTGKALVLLAFSLPGVGNVGFFRKLFLGEGDDALWQHAPYPIGFWGQQRTLYGRTWLHSSGLSKTLIMLSSFLALGKVQTSLSSALA